ncbi:MAG: TolC family protein [Candidatus Omnitrophota bacterium]
MKRFLFYLVAVPILLSSFPLSRAEDTTKEIFEREEAIRRALFIASAGQERVLKIGLVDCIGFALKNNSEVRIKKIEPLISQQDIRIAESVFDPTLNVEASSEDTKEQSSSSSFFSPAVSKSHTNKLNIGVGGKTPLGAEYDISFDNKKYKSNAPFQTVNPYNKSEATIILTQPLLKGFGTFVNRANITIAKNNLKKSDQELKSELLQILSDVKKAYYNYLLNLEKQKTAEVSLKRAQDLLGVIQKRYEKGLAHSVDLLEAQNGVAKREDELLAVERSLKLAEDNLKYVTNIIDEPELWNARIEPLDTLNFEATDVDLVESLKQAFEYRPDYEAAKIELMNQDIRIKLKENDLLPRIDLVGSFGLNGLDENYLDALKNEAEGKYRDWSAGVKISFPWGNRQAKAELEKTKLAKAQLLLSFERLQQNIILEVRDAARGINITEKKVLTSLKLKETEEARYAAIEKRFAEGLVSTHDMVEYQEDLSAAQTNYIQSLIDYHDSIVTLDKKIGVTLVKNDVKLE